ncbi:DUF2510 domain-containing protein [Microbacterium sp. M3]|uniref:DUF2510 domain-containing protein n=1 Tax=Microbacterium arthrosphaerae TaxID=792652 RepID=A0ABU4GZW4_9MICO|nr:MULTISPECIES: DUF2510 domain-containing protein [Microbacterium]MDW4572607.1 DUF2510 domain-containing protein [Microbacterium arthrosphaerae]MDW7606462.1 DUF2510 domain-containing protein [Microbacterium sp. M3]
MSMRPLPPAGWYPDPHRIAEQRWWDGQMWTEHVHPAAARLVVEEPAAVAPAEPAASEPARPEKYPTHWSAGKREKRSREAMRWLLPGESPLYQFSANCTRPLTTEVVVTDLRVFTYGVNKFGRSVLNSEIEAAGLVRKSIVIALAGEETLTLSSVEERVREPALAAVRSAMTQTPPAEALEELQRRAAEAADAEADAEAESAEQAARWADTTILGPVRGKSYRSIARLSYDGEVPWLVMGSWAAGVLAAFEDRLVIVKTGALTSFMAGALGGERATTFYFADITAIEYNSGFLSGVLEVLTASYQGSANKDYWRGKSASRNANSNDPWTLSNTLPMTKPEYIEWTPHIQDLRAKVAAAKRPPAAPVILQSGSNLAEELGKLGALRESGILTAEEFTAAKARLIAGTTG